MPGNPQECRDNAKRCLELAQASSMQTGKERFAELALTWLALARDYEATNLLIADFGASPAQHGSVAATLCCEAEAEQNF